MASRHNKPDLFTEDACAAEGVGDDVGGADGGTGGDDGRGVGRWG